jgi:hypothetical protein
LHHLARWLTSIEKDDENMRIFLADTLDFTFTNDIKIKIEMKSQQERIHLSFPPEGGGLLRLSRAFSATLTGRFGMGTVRMGAEGRW